MNIRHSLVAILLYMLVSPSVAEPVTMEVYKSPTCGCCGKWVSHLENNDFVATGNDLSSKALNEKKNALGIKPEYQSCHVGVSKDGYVFEGHIPASVIKRFLAEKPEGAIGLAVPGMPVGSPGMEMGQRFQEYDVLLLKKDGTNEVYERIKNLSQSTGKEGSDE